MRRLNPLRLLKGIWDGVSRIGGSGDEVDGYTTLEGMQDEVLWGIRSSWNLP